MINITPLTPGFGADISGIDLKTINSEQFAQVYEAWLAFSVLRFRNQPLSDDELQKFSRRFGPLEEIPFGRMPQAQRNKIKNRYVTAISNIIVDGKPIGGLGNAEASWHSDMTYLPNPPPASILLAVEVPPGGGDTLFANQYAAYDAVPADLLARVSGMRIKHNAAHTSVGRLRPGFDTFDSPLDAPGAAHPIVRTHDETQRPCLYLGRRDWAYIPGLTIEESEALLDELWSFAAIETNTWCQRWQPDDLIIWDNRCVLHRRTSFDAQSRRMLRRCQVLSRSAQNSEPFVTL
ncbi:MAG: TauD/TfdA family dioxygenase [Proteobacteria bacterium]|nr:TauD/TfdA family dioxygenase [Pseudomonadota bacterium]